MERDISKYVPKGNIGIFSERRSGKCIVCGRRFPRNKLILRTSESKLVCLKDSPHISDEDILLYTRDTSKWPQRRLKGLDANAIQFGDRIISVDGNRPRSK